MKRHAQHISQAQGGAVLVERQRIIHGNQQLGLQAVLFEVGQNREQGAFPRGTFWPALAGQRDAPPRREPIQRFARQRGAHPELLDADQTHHGGALAQQAASAHQTLLHHGAPRGG